jgi:hypothetical protein
MRFQKQRNIYDEGLLTDLAESILAGVPTKDLRRMSTDEMHRLPEIYAQVDFDPSSTGSILEYIDSDKTYKTGNNKAIFGRDIKAITSLMYLKPRSAYWKPDKPQIHDTSVCGAVPIPMLGFRRWKDINYQDWLSKRGECEVEDYYNLDLLLGYTLADTKYNKVTDTVAFNTHLGLGRFSIKYYDPGWRLNYTDVRNYREVNMGNYKGSFASTYGAITMPNPDKDQKIAMHNACTVPMKLMLTQRWAWYGKHRNTDMICDFQDWDNIPKSVDDLSVSLAGLEPTNTDKAMNTRFGIG